MKDILDELESEKKNQTYTWLALICGIIALFSFSYIMYVMSAPITPAKGFIKPSILIVRTSQIFTILGSLFTIMIFVKNEKTSWKTWITTILNVILFITVVGVICFFYFIELTK